MTVRNHESLRTNHIHRIAVVYMLFWITLEFESLDNFILG